ncbi:MAG: peptide deformylase, partial [Planctomycetota bacterium]
QILYYPEPALRKKAALIKDINQSASGGGDYQEKAEGMLELMYEACGVGLAANQVGWLERLIVKDETGERTGERVFINPEIIHSEGETLEEEGCLSLPGVLGKVSRAQKVVVVAFTLKGERLEMEVEDLPARVWQHEIDHLNGTLIIDRMTPASRLTVSRRLKELEQMYEEGVSRIRAL